jgi:type IV/VI secretion system ImpK/VasF family protein
MSPSTLDLTVWDAITAAVADTETFVDGALGADQDAPDLEALSRKLVVRFDGLREQLERALGETKTRQVLAPLTFLVDERVLGRLSSRSLDAELDWPLLQRRVVDLEYGGDLFFMQAERLALGPAPCSLLVQVFEYCLRQGFEGRYADRPEIIAELRRRLWARIEPPRAPSLSIDVPADRAARTPRTWRRLALIALGAAAAWQLLLFVGFARL